MLATVANLAIVVAMCMAVMVGAISTEAPEASPAMADTIAEEEYMAGVARMRDCSYVHLILNFCIRHWSHVLPLIVFLFLLFWEWGTMNSSSSSSSNSSNRSRMERTYS